MTVRPDALWAPAVRNGMGRSNVLGDCRRMAGRPGEER